MTTSLLSPIGHELLDDPEADPAAVRESLHHLARSNRWFGGAAAAWAGVRRLLGPRPATRLTLLDVGTGAGDIPRGLAARLARRGVTLRSVGIDRHRAAAAVAARRGVPAAVADAFALPLGPGAVDLVVVSQLAHHFLPAGVVALARECSRVARVGVVLADLHRSAPARLGFALGSLALRFDRVTRVDGLTSLTRGFTAASLGSVLAEAGVRATISRHWGARIVATWTTAR